MIKKATLHTEPIDQFLRMSQLSKLEETLDEQGMMLLEETLDE